MADLQPRSPRSGGGRGEERANRCRGAGKNVDIKFSGGGQRGPSKSEFLQKRSSKSVVAKAWGLRHDTAQGPPAG